MNFCFCNANLLLSTLETNNRGVGLLGQGENKRAILVFRSGLQRLLTGLRDHNSNTKSSETPSKYQGSPASLETSSGFVIDCFPCPQQGRRMLESEGHKQENANRFAIFDRAIRITPEAINFGRNLDWHCHSLTAVLFFNTALSFHRIALEQQGEEGSASPKLFKALALYQLSRDTLDKIPQESLCVMNVVLLATINNIGSVKNSTRQPEEASTNGMELFSRLIAISSNQQERPSHLTEEEARLFFANACLLQEMKPNEATNA